jgi:hypothetical protein
MSEIVTVTEDMLKAKIKRESYYQPEGTTLTVCVLELHNGFLMVGKSACISPSFFDAEKGKQIAKADAIDRMWELEGYYQKESSWARKQRAMELEEAED